ncbi:MAG: hypothetical protein JWO86_2058 [Myxococcaceae bacterium]|nr:hypothetical protein [Myxococcaceae bacterium]
MPPMLLARAVSTVGRGKMAWAVAFAPRLRLSIVERSGLTLDTQFVPASPLPANRNPCLYILLRGSWRADDGVSSFVGPAAFVVSEEHLEGADGERPLTYRTDRERFAMIEVHVDAADSPLRAGIAPAKVDLDTRAWEAAQRLADLASHDDESMTRAVSALLESLAALSFLNRDVTETAAQPPNAAFRLLWKAVRPLAERLDLLPTVQQLSAATGVSPRVVDRSVRAFLSAAGLVGDGWRTASRHMRLKMAVIMLSADETTVGEVAQAIGYGSDDAMARAFRDAKLPPPGAVRDALRVT